MSWRYPYGNPIIETMERLLGGIEINQNQPPANTDHGINPGFAWYYQQFQLPSDFVRGTRRPNTGPNNIDFVKGAGPPNTGPNTIDFVKGAGPNTIIPQISGIQVKTQVPKHLTEQATLDYTLDCQLGDVWTNLAQGISIGATVYGDEIWFDIIFSAPVTVTADMLNATFRFGVRGRQPPPVKHRHKCLPIRRWGNRWYYYNYFRHYGNSFDTYGYDPFYENYPYYEWGYYGFPYFYLYPWWGEYWGDYYGVTPYLPFTNPWSSGWAFPYGYYNQTFYNNWYWYYYGYPYAPYNFYEYFRDYYLVQTEDWRWWHYWDEWDYDGDTFPILAFDQDVIPDFLEDLEDETPYPIIFEDYYCYLYKHAEPEYDEQWGFWHKYCLHTQYGLPWLWFSSPNPYVRTNDSYVTDENEDQVLQDGGTISFMFRLLTLTADQGTDEFGQTYRSTVVIHSAENLNTLNSEANQNLNWFSKPNPSKYAVENLYFDISNGSDPQVIDRVYIDPITTGVYFSIYYTNDGTPGSTNDEWENKIWNRVPRTYQLTKAQSYVLPAPITAKYICIEFSHLQAKPYNAPDLAQPILYKKHPKWVLDYFLLRTAQLQNDGSKFISGAIQVNYNALQLAYSYYMDDLNQSPSGIPDIAQLQRFFSANTDNSDQIDATMLREIRTIFKPYVANPSVSLDPNNIISQYANVALSQARNYQTEADPTAQLPQVSSLVSSLNRDNIIFDANFPVMYFYIACPHTYRVVSANFDLGTAYSVGIQQLAFQREHYTVQYDSPAYIERGGDDVNIELNDLVRVDDAWAIYARATGS